MLDLSQKNLKFRNRCWTSGNAMEIFNISRRVAALGHTYFRVVCCCLSIFLASVFLVRVLHPCVALALWKLLGGCGMLWMGYGCCMLMGRAASPSHWQYDFLYVIALRCCGQGVGNISQAVWFAHFYSSSNEGGKHLTGTLFLHLRVEITMWNASEEYSMCLSHPRIAAALCEMKPVSALPSLAL